MPSDMCFPYGNVSRGAGGEIIEVSDPKFECIEKCLMTRYIDEERPYLALRMFDHADANRDGKVNAADLQPIGKFLDKGFGASYRAGYELVDYDQNKEVELWEYFMRLDSPEYASFQGKTRCEWLQNHLTGLCTVCDDDGNDEPYDDCY